MKPGRISPLTRDVLEKFIAYQGDAERARRIHFENAAHITAWNQFFVDLAAAWGMSNEEMGRLLVEAIELSFTVRSISSLRISHDPGEDIHL